MRISEKSADDEWDNFVLGSGQGHHAQTSWWSKAKLSRNGQCLRLVVERDGKIAAGLQLVTSPLPALGSAGYVAKGPIVDEEDVDLQRLLVDELLRVARTRQLRLLIVQPHKISESMQQLLSASGFKTSPVTVAPSATVLIDLQPDLDDIMAGFKKSARRAIRRGRSGGVTGRLGTRDDIEAFHQLHLHTSQRLSFRPFPVDYYLDMWDNLSPGGHLALFMVEYEHQPVSAQIIVAFKDTVTAKAAGWSGQHGKLGPNHLLDWTTIKWAKSEGYHRYDLEGLNRQVAMRYVTEGVTPDMESHGKDYYKLNFGGEVQLYSEPFVYVPNPVLRTLYTSVYPKVQEHQLVNRALSHLRVG